jgi:hypothetical protein
VSSNPVYGEVYSIQHYVIKFVSDLKQVSSFLPVLRFSTNKIKYHDIIEILLEVVLNTINLTSTHYCVHTLCFAFCEILEAAVKSYSDHANAFYFGGGEWVQRSLKPPKILIRI